MSVIDYVDKVMLWDSGSSDNTLKIIQKIQRLKGKKIDFRQVGPVDGETFTKIRQEMLNQTKSDWILILDGDEVWWEKSIKRVVAVIQEKGDKLETIISPYYNVIGDIYHYQEQAAGQYRIDNLKGHYNIRAINRKILGLHLEKPHGQQGFYDGEGNLIQERSKKFRYFLDAPYLHFTNMMRSSSKMNDKKVPKRSVKFKYEVGIPFSKNFKYPEVFYLQRPDTVPVPWKRTSFSFLIRAIPETLIKKLKRRFLPFQKIGY